MHFIVNATLDGGKTERRSFDSQAEAETSVTAYSLDRRCVAAIATRSDNGEFVQAYRRPLEQAPVGAKPARVTIIDGLSELEKRIFDGAANLERLRELRLWHWEQALHCRAESQAFAKLAKVSASAKACNSMAGNWHEKANLHVKFVQTLNDFFPVGDTAENDAAEEAGK
jgi:hypothetical protein